MTKPPRKAESFDVLVVGAGPAGLIAAAVAACDGTRTALVEQLDRPALKLLASGGGRCNFTNTLDHDAFMAAFGKHGRFLQPALAAFDNQALRRFLDELGVPSKSPDGFHVYPESESSRSVADALRRLCARRAVRTFLSTRADALVVRDGRVAGVRTAQGSMTASRVLLAAGGQGYPDLGGSRSGYELAQAAGHSITPLVPALVPLVTRERWPHALAGVAVSGARLWIDLPGARRAGAEGDILFTHRGISGPAVLDLSGAVAQRLAEAGAVPLRIDLTPRRDREAWISVFESWQRHHGRGKVLGALGRHLPSSLCAALLRLAGCPEDTVAAEWRREHRDRIADLLTALPLTISGTEGFERAMVTRGGVSLREVDPRTLESRLVKGLFFAGEVLDLDGPSGGFNLQWAFSSGHLAGLCAGNKKG